jgi:hypothetical protein
MSLSAAQPEMNPDGDVRADSAKTTSQDTIPTTANHGESISPTSGADAVLTTLLDAARERLIGLDGRTPLLNYKLLRSRGVAIEGESPEILFRILVQEGKQMYFNGIEQNPDTVTPEQELKQPPLTDEELNDNRINTPHLDTELQTRLVKTANQARIDRDDRGVHTLHLALGFMTVSIDGQNKANAPLLLVPVHLQREGSKGRFRLVASEDGPVPNYALEVYLQTTLGIDLPRPSLQPEGGNCPNLSEFFNAVAEAIRDNPSVVIQRDPAALSLFSFEGVSLYNDLDPSQWPTDKAPNNSPTLLRLVTKGEARPVAAEQPPLGNITDHTLVVPVDASQLRCIEHASTGNDLVIYGPPGTGKSHTITAMIASLVAQGKKILFVSQKAAALHVVHQNLTNLGLGDLSLVLHSDTMPRKEVIASLKATLEAEESPPVNSGPTGDAMKSAQAELVAHTEGASSLVGDYRITFHDVVGRLALASDVLSSAIDNGFASTIELRGGLTVDEVSRAIATAEQLQTAIKSWGSTGTHPFIGSTATSPLLPESRKQAAQSLNTAATSVVNFEQALASLCEELQVSPPQSLRDSGRLMAALKTIKENAEIFSSHPDLSLNHPEWRDVESRPSGRLTPLKDLTQLRDTMTKTLSPEAWNITDPKSLRADIELLRKDKLYFTTGAYWRLRSDMRSAYRVPKFFEKWDEWLNTLQDLSKAQELKKILLSDPLNGSMRKLLTETTWRGPDTDPALATRVAELCESLVEGHAQELYFSRVAEIAKSPEMRAILREKLATLENLRQTLLQDLELAMNEVHISPEETEKLCEMQPLTTLRERISQMSSQIERLDEIVTINHLTAELSRHGATLSARALQQDAQGIALYLAARIDHQWSTAVISDYTNGNPAHTTARGTDVELLCNRYDTALQDLLETNRSTIMSAQMSPAARLVDRSHMKYVENEVRKRRNFRPIRELMYNASEAVQAIKPVIMASPASVARFLPPDSSLHFDAVIIDEGSQVPPEEALGPLARGAQMIVVGDSKQMPPSRLFSRSVDSDGAESDLADESVLDMAVGRGISPYMLTHHRRSRHPSLIELASELHYDNRLQIMPSPFRNSSDLGLRFVRVENAVYDRGGTGTNKEEAAAIVQAIAQHAQQHPGRSLGVVAFNSRQADEILLQLEKQARDDEALSRFLQSAHPDRPFFVRSLENVQGDERDTIFVSVGFGHDQEGGFSMNFGPLNVEGGERRLNVLMTRSRWECRVFASFDPQELRVDASNLGPKHLKKYLVYAKARTESAADSARTASQPARHPFARALQNKLAKEGIQAEELVHTDGSVDLAIVDPSDTTRHCLAVILDGTPRGVSLPGAGLPELRAGLESNGWRTHFVSTADLLYRPTQVVETICQLARPNAATPT